jgi:hypothetical protein
VGQGGFDFESLAGATLIWISRRREEASSQSFHVCREHPPAQRELNFDIGLLVRVRQLGGVGVDGV